MTYRIERLQTSTYPRCASRRRRSGDAAPTARDESTRLLVRIAGSFSITSTRKEVNEQKRSGTVSSGSGRAFILCARAWEADQKMCCVLVVIHQESAHDQLGF